MNFLRCAGIFLIAFLSFVMCQDRIIGSNLDLDETQWNSSMENDTVPESLLIQMANVSNVLQLIRRFIVFEKETPILGSASRNNTQSRKARPSVAQANIAQANIAQPANCQTKQHVVELDKHENGATIYWPPCVRVRRCGGCCTSTMLACKPLATSILNVTVLQMHYNHENPNSFESQGTRTFSLEQHDRCACICKETAEDCEPDVHYYRSNECRCVCKNAEQASSCTGPKKVWDSKYCECKCRKMELCSSGRLFSPLTCKCEIQRRSLATESVNQHNSNISSLQYSTATL